MKYLIISLMLVSGAVHANETESLKEGVKLCAAALTACEQQNDLSRALDKDKSLALEYHKKDAAEMRDKQNSVFNNPWLYGAAGIILGVIITK